MNVLILCFSQTGNTRKIAESIRTGVLNADNVCDLYSMDAFDPEWMTRYDLIGIGAPVFYYKEPFHVSDFLTALPQMDGKNWFVFCTHGTVFGNFFPSVVEKLEKKNARVIGCHHTYADISVPFYPKPSYTAGHPDKIDLSEAEQFGSRIVEKISTDREKKSILGTPDCPVSSEGWIESARQLTPEIMKKIFPELVYHPETCTGCLACEENCPVCGIDLSADPPILQQPCVFCWRCTIVCPTLSISADWGALAENAPAQYAKYKKELDKETAAGNFRWLTDPEQIDFSRPLFMQQKES